MDFNKLYVLKKTNPQYESRQHYKNFKRTQSLATNPLHKINCGGYGLRGA